MNAPHDLSVAELSKRLRQRAFSAVELAEHFLARTRQHAELGAFLAQDEEVTLAQARAADQQLAADDAPPLAGVPIAHKDMLATTDFDTTAGSNMLAGYRSPLESTATSRLAKAGMVCLGKLNCDEFGMGASGESSAFGPVRNPWDQGHVAGGSSAGSAAAVAARLAPAATGVDTGGSIRQPASFCGLTSLRPTYGRVSRHGLIAFASSFDQAGPMARSAEDCALLLSAMAGADIDRDSTSLDLPAEDFTRGLNESIDGLRIGLPREFFGDSLSDDVRTAIDAALSELEKLGASLVPISLPRTALAPSAYTTLASAEASTNLSRFDGVRYGHRAREYGDVEDMYKKSRSEGFGAETKRHLLIGTYVLSQNQYERFYVQAQKLRRLIADDLQQAFGTCDVIAGPVAPSVAWSLGPSADGPGMSGQASIYTAPASLAGLPAISAPAGLGRGGLPVGLQLVGNHLQEARLLNVAHRLQQATDWHTRKPQGF